MPYNCLYRSNASTVIHNSSGITKTKMTRADFVIAMLKEPKKLSSPSDNRIYNIIFNTSASEITCDSEDEDLIKKVWSHLDESQKESVIKACPDFFQDKAESSSDDGSSIYFECQDFPCDMDLIDDDVLDDQIKASATSIIISSTLNPAATPERAAINVVVKSRPSTSTIPSAITTSSVSQATSKTSLTTGSTPTITASISQQVQLTYICISVIPLAIFIIVVIVILAIYYSESRWRSESGCQISDNEFLVI